MGPQIGSGRFGGDPRYQEDSRPTGVAAQICEVTPEFIVRYRPRTDGSVEVHTSPMLMFKEAFLQTRAEADELALSLVHHGESDPASISIYENTTARVHVTIQTAPRPPQR